MKVGRITVVAVTVAASFVFGATAAHAKSISCASERKAIEVAEKAYKIENGHYTTVGELLTAHVLDDFPRRYQAVRINAYGYLIIPLRGSGCSGKVIRG